MDDLKETRMKHPTLSILAISAAALFGTAQLQAATDKPAVKGGQESVQGQAKGMAQDRPITGDPKTRAEVKADAASGVVSGQQSAKGQAKGTAQDKPIAGAPKTRAEVKAEAAATNPGGGQESVKGQAKGQAQDKKP